MAYYDALISAWNTSSSGGGLPANTTGSSLQGQTTAEKLVRINNWVHTGSIPTTIYVTGDQVRNCISYAEFKTLPAQKQSNLLTLLDGSGSLKGGSANTDSLLVGMLLDSFAGNSTTITNLSAMATAAQIPWWQFASYPRAFDMGDITAAGLS